MPERFIGRSIGPYQVERLLGGGGSAWVFQAHDPALEIDVALKVLKPHLADDPAAVERFRREATTAARLRHPNIVTIRAVGRLGEATGPVAAGTPFLVMDLLPGSLAERLADGRPLPEGELLAIGEDVARALAWAHEHGVIHRDVKPDNVLLDRDGRAVVTDFGIARAIAEGLAGNTRSAVIGTPNYFAPEQARGLPLDGRADVYGLGVTLYQAATGVLPFAGDDWYTVMRRHVEEPPAPPHTLNPMLSASTEQVILRALEKAPEDRWADAEAMCKAIAAARRAASGDGATVEVRPLTGEYAAPARAHAATRGGAPLGLGGDGGAVATAAPPLPASRTAPRNAARPGDRMMVAEAEKRARSRTIIAATALVATGAAAALLATRGGEGPATAPATPRTAPPPRVDSVVTPPALVGIDSSALRADTLRRPRGTLSVVAPPDANITVQGRLVGRGTWRGDSVAPGSYNVSATVPTLPGCPTATQFRVVTLAANQRQRVRLTPMPCAQVALDLKPDGALYQLTGPDTLDGRAPIVGPILVPAGTYRLKVSARFCSSYDEEHRFATGDGPQRVRVRLICD